MIEKLRLLGNCGNRVTYRYGDDEVRQVFEAIEEEVQRTKAQFQQKKTRDFLFK